MVFCGKTGQTDTRRYLNLIAAPLRETNCQESLLTIK